MGADSRREAFKAWLAANGTNVSRVAKKAHVPYTTLASFVTGDTQSLKGSNEAKIATAYGVSVEQIFGSPGAPAPSAPKVPDAHIELPVRYVVAAGAWAALDELAQDPSEPELHRAIDDPRYRGVEQWLERVEGDSYNRRVPDGALVHVVDALAIEYQPRHGDTVVVVRSRAQGAFHERTLKQIEMGPEGVRLWPRSYNPKWSEPIDYTQGLTDPAFDEVRIVGLVIQAYIGFDG
jgi:transcriptional regulator with XRE-family HTH domain